MNETVQDLMVEPLTVDKNEHLPHAIERMEKNHSSWIIVTHDDSIRGIMGYRDLGRELGSVTKSEIPSSSLHVSTATREVDRTLSPDDTVPDAVDLLTELDVGMLPVVRDGDVVGMLREEELLDLVDSDLSASDVMEDTETLSPDDRLVHARERMQDTDSWRLPVVEGGRLIGILTETDVAKSMKNFRDLVRGDRQDTRVRNILVEDVMSTDLTSCRDTDLVTVARDLLKDSGVGGLPVLDADGDVVGIITRANVVSLLG